jgi:hypothetical protein
MEAVAELEVEVLQVVVLTLIIVQELVAEMLKVLLLKEILAVDLDTVMLAVKDMRIIFNGQAAAVAAQAAQVKIINGAEDLQELLRKAV